MDNKITDKGWTAMRTLLDREMPTSRRRRFAWWWFGLLLLPIAVYGSWKWRSTPAKTAPQTEIGPAATIATTSVPQTSMNQTQNLLQTEHSAANQPEKSTSSNSTQIGNQFTNLNIRQKSSPEKPVKNELAIAQSAAKSTTIADPETETPLPATAIAQPLLSTQNLETPLQTLDFQNNSPLNIASNSHPIKPRKLSDLYRKSWAFGATTAISTEQFNFINGFSTGVTVDWKFARKWGLRTGLMYNIHTPQEKHRPIASVRSDDYTSKVDGNVLILNLLTGDPLSAPSGITAYSDSLGGNVLIPISRLQRLELPVTVFYQAARPLKIIAGLSLARNISTKADRQNYSGDYILRLTDQVAEDGASELSSGELARWSADATLGLGLTLSKNFELGFATKIPLNNTKNLKKTTEALSSGNLSDEVRGRTNRLDTPLFSLYGTLFF